jgi:subtilisin family serine protease
MGIDEAHALSTGEGVTVAVIDSVVDVTVPELADANVVPAFNACAADPVGEGLGSGFGSQHGTAMVSMVSQAAPDATIRVYAYTDIADHIETAIDGGTVVLAAVDDGPDVGLPALHSTDLGVVAVTAVGPDGKLGDYVVPGQQVVIAAPGTSIRTEAGSSTAAGVPTRSPTGRVPRRP